MSDLNKQIVRRFEDAFNDNDEATIDELCDPHLVDHNPAPGEDPDLHGFKRTAAMYHRAMGGSSQQDLKQIVAEGDYVATLWTVRGTQHGEVFGIAPSGKSVEIEGMNIYRLSGGKVTDIWTQFDLLGLMQQLGAMPKAS